jgi:hypothetical protein
VRGPIGCKIANREPSWEPDRTANLVRPRTRTENKLRF